MTRTLALLALLLFSAELFANMSPPLYRVSIPSGQEKIYQFAGPVFAALAIAATGLWWTRGQTLRAGAKRALLWASAGCLAVAFSAWWLWEHRNAGLNWPGWLGWLALDMPKLWIAFCLVILVAGWRRERGRDQPEPSSLDHDPLSVLKLGAETLERVQAAGIRTVAQLSECTGNPALYPETFDTATIVEIRESLAEHGLGRANGQQSTQGREDWQLAWAMLVLAVFVAGMNPFTRDLVILLLAVGIGFGIASVRFERGVGQFWGGLAVVLQAGLALLLIIDQRGRGW